MFVYTTMDILFTVENNRELFYACLQEFIDTDSLLILENLKKFFWEFDGIIRCSS